MRVIRAPTVRRGERITARWANELAGAVNEALQPPKDKDTGVTEDEAQAERTINEVERTTETVRIENPEDSEQYVDVARAVTSTLLDVETGRRWLITWDSSAT